MEPSATVSATMMNVLYAGIDNPVSISVPGVPTGGVTASMTNGTLTRSGDGWTARPDKVGSDAVITVSAALFGRDSTECGHHHLPSARPPRSDSIYRNRRRALPGGRMLPKAQLLAAKGLGAAIDDGMLNIDFKGRELRDNLLRLYGKCHTGTFRRIILLTPPARPIQTPEPRQALLHLAHQGCRARRQGTHPSSRPRGDSRLIYMIPYPTTLLHTLT